MNPRRLKALIKVLREGGVAEYVAGEVTLRLYPAPLTEALPAPRVSKPPISVPENPDEARAQRLREFINEVLPRV